MYANYFRWLTTLIGIVFWSFTNAQTVEDIASCMLPVTGVKQDISSSLDSLSSKSLMVYKAWQSSATTEGEAISQGINLDIVIDELPIKGSAEEKKQTYFKHKDELSKNYFDANQKQRLLSLKTSLTSVPVYQRAADTADNCIRAISEAGYRHCSAVENDNQITVSLTARYGESEARATLTSTRATLTKPGSSRTVTLWEPSQAVPPKGLVTTIVRDPDEAVSFDVNSSAGLFSCKAIPARPKLVISGKIYRSVTNFVTKTGEVPLAKIYRSVCAGQLVQRVDHACAPGAGTITDIALSPNTRPKSLIENQLSCSSVRIKDYIPDPAAPNCAHILYELNECKMPPYYACPNTIDPATEPLVNITYNSSDSTKSVEEKFNTDITGTSITISYESVKPLMGKPDIKYEATVTDIRSGKTFSVSSDEPKNGPISTSLNPKSMELLIITR